MEDLRRQKPERESRSGYSLGKVPVHPPGKTVTDGLPAPFQATSSPGENRTGLPTALKVALEQLSGVDLSGVRVRYNSSKPARFNALAYTQGQHIEVGPGQERHLPHEGWHLTQQMRGRVKPTLRANGASINDDAALEREADVMGAKAAQMMRSGQAATSTSPAAPLGQGFSLANVRPTASQPIQRTKWIYLSKEEGLVDTDNPDHTYNSPIPQDMKPGDTWDDVTNTFTRGSERMAKIFGGTSNQAPALEFPSPESFAEILRARTSTQHSSGGGSQVETVPAEARTVMAAFSAGGLLIKTVQTGKAHLDFQDAGAPASERSGVAQGRYGPKRNWSLIHERLIANPYLMKSTAAEQDEVADLHQQASGSNIVQAEIAKKSLAKSRSMALLADPYRIGDDRFLGIHESDAASNANLSGDAKTIPPERAMPNLEALKKRLFAKQAEAHGRIDNSEIQTIGFNPEAVVGFVFKPGNFSSWETARPYFQSVVDIIASPQANLPGFTPSPRESFPVFTYLVDDATKTTRLVYLDTLIPH